MFTLWCKLRLHCGWQLRNLSDSSSYCLEFSSTFKLILSSSSKLEPVQSAVVLMSVGYLVIYDRYLFNFYRFLMLVLIGATGSWNNDFQNKNGVAQTSLRINFVECCLCLKFTTVANTSFVQNNNVTEYNLGIFESAAGEWIAFTQIANVGVSLQTSAAP